MPVPNTHDGANGGTEEGHDRIDTHGKTALLWVKHVGNDATSVGHGAAAKGACKEAQHEQCIEVFGSAHSSTKGGEGNVRDDEHGTASKDL
jgi:hypothetical protein